MSKAAAWVAGLVLLLGGPGAVAQAAPTPMPVACPGVLVVVQYRDEAPVSRCAERFGTGREALVSAGFGVTDEGSMICRIDHKPSSCKVSATAYWSYWHAARQSDGGWAAWSYSTLGATSYQPVAGDVEGWVFGDGGAPPSYPWSEPPARPRPLPPRAWSLPRRAAPPPRAAGPAGPADLGRPGRNPDGRGHRRAGGRGAGGRPDPPATGLTWPSRSARPPSTPGRGGRGRCCWPPGSA
ncbi:MAG: hypothetical protein HZY73_13845 [Micropruina sp.]|nr:MAG: hypothetical protein HZY73_13845 [Micropruina sp.]